jgi:myo-inositol-1(or 4)-monophosphatase
MKLTAELALAVEAAMDSGKLLALAGYLRSSIILEHGKDIKLNADRHAEEIILKKLESSGLPILTEEAGEQGLLEDKAPFWIVDPLDGTFNYHRGIGLCCVSIALWLGNSPLLGVINDFNNNEVFKGVVGEAAELNGERIRVSAVKDREKAVLATGFPVNRDYSEGSLQDFIGKVHSFKKIRMFGSAAISSAYVACGRLDAYVEDNIMLWDVAAGAALVAAAGGWVDVRPAAGKKWATLTRFSSSAKLWED